MRTNFQRKINEEGQEYYIRTIHKSEKDSFNNFIKSHPFGNVFQSYET